MTTRVSEHTMGAMAWDIAHGILLLAHIKLMQMGDTEKHQLVARAAQPLRYIHLLFVYDSEIERGVMIELQVKSPQSLDLWRQIRMAFVIEESARAAFPLQDNVPHVDDANNYLKALMDKI